MTRGDSITTQRLIKIGNYKFTGNRLGKGSVSVLEEAIHAELHVNVCVKVVQTDKVTGSILKCLKREVMILKELNHPNVIRVFEALKWDHLFCLVIEIVNGPDLHTYLMKHKHEPLKEKDTRKLSRQICMAVNYLHDKGIVHRNLRLENIMIDHITDMVKLVDFDLSNHWSESSPLSTLCCSLEYSAPELFTPDVRYGPEVDMWALGVIFYALAFGRLPFTCRTSDPEKKAKFVLLINKGLPESHIDQILVYSSEFLVLVKGLLNPNRHMRLTANGALKNYWLSNNNRWIKPRYETLDAYDIAIISQKLCHKLNITQDKLHTELQINPLGEIAGFYNLMSYDDKCAKQMTIGSSTKAIISTTPKLASRKTVSNDKQTEVMRSRLSMIGAVIKINEVRPDSRNKGVNVYTSPNLTSLKLTHRSNCSESNSSDINQDNSEGDWITPSRFKIIEHIITRRAAEKREHTFLQARKSLRKSKPSTNIVDCNLSQRRIDSKTYLSRIDSVSTY